MNCSRDSSTGLYLAIHNRLQIAHYLCRLILHCIIYFSLFTHSSVEHVDISSLELLCIIQPSHSCSRLWIPICAFLLGICTGLVLWVHKCLYFYIYSILPTISQSSWADFYPHLPIYTHLDFAQKLLVELPGAFHWVSPLCCPFPLSVLNTIGKIKGKV